MFKNSAIFSVAKFPAYNPDVLSEKIRPRPVLSNLLEPASLKQELHAARQHTQKKQSTLSSLESKEDMRAFFFAVLINTLDLKELSQLEPEEAREEVRDVLIQFIQARKPLLPLAEIDELLEDICNHVLGYGPLEPLLARDNISHIIVNGPSSTFIEVNGKIQKTSVSFKDAKHILNICWRILKQCGRQSPLSQPLSDVRMSDGSQINIVLPPLSVEGPALTIHRAGKLRFGFEQLVKIGALSEEARSLLETLRCARTNILISGGRSSGKTTLVNCLLEGVKQEERIIICGDAVGFNLRRSNILHLEGRPKNFDGEGQITMQDLVKQSLHLRPQHIVVDELRGSEVFNLLKACIEGQEGILATLLAHSPREALSRIEDIIFTSGCGLNKQDVREHVSRLFPILVQTVQLPDGSRKVSEIREVCGVENNTIVLKNLFSYGPNITQSDGRTP